MLHLSKSSLMPAKYNSDGMLSSYNSALSCLFDLIVIVEQLLQASSDDEIVVSGCQVW